VITNGARPKSLSAIYFAHYARERIASADAAIAGHVASAYTGCCRTCGPGPCDDQVAAERVLAGYGLLPRRDPGSTLRPSATAFVWPALNRTNRSSDENRRSRESA
jgi:hypothetical protein